MACLFVLKVLTTLAVYNMPEINAQYTQRQLPLGDKVCVIAIEKGFLRVSWKNDYGGYVWVNVKVESNVDREPE